MKKLYLILFSSIALVAIWFSCNIDHGLYPIDYIIKGKVIFLRGKPPENTDRIEVFALKEFPPQDPRNYVYLGESGALDFKSGNEIDYEVRVSRTRYDAVVLLWKEKGYKISLTGLIGIYTTPEQYPLPVAVNISKEYPVADSIDIYSDWNKVTKDASISGKINYKGDWPEETKLLLLVVYKQKPKDETTLLFFENIDYTQSLKVDSSSYRLLLSRGKYHYIVLFWVGKSFKNLSDLKEIGFYASPDNPEEPGIVDLTAGGDAENIDIYVDFNNIQFPGIK